ncbi:uncharacterized, partial [Tachysurus ichikawai]
LFSSLELHAQLPSVLQRVELGLAALAVYLTSGQKH